MFRFIMGDVGVTQRDARQYLFNERRGGNEVVRGMENVHEAREGKEEEKGEQESRGKKKKMKKKMKKKP